MRFCTLLGCDNAIWTWTGRPVHDVALHMLVLSVVVAFMVMQSTQKHQTHTANSSSAPANISPKSQGDHIDESAINDDRLGDR
ncbi:unnamed protein product [Clonostachys solani]|uniref:Uncharacterized protein n=1 Tax=Clonostachys solani TaxID=160281 RepID=A0A9N9ZF96_9HYPO|nr:unnamed protein product [Clonostachys solani]